MANINFPLAMIAVLDESGVSITSKEHTFDSTDGGSIEASISGLSSEPTTVSASDIDFYISQRGTGSLELDLSLFELSDQQEADILGYEYDEATKTIKHGTRTNPPYVAVILKSSDPKTGEDLYFGLTRGKLSKSDVEFNTNTTDGVEPNTVGLTGKFAARPLDGLAYTKHRAPAGSSVKDWIDLVFNRTVTP